MLEVEQVIPSAQIFIIIQNKFQSNNNIVFCLSKEIIEEVSKREKVAGIIPDHDINLYMKVR